MNMKKLDDDIKRITEDLYRGMIHEAVNDCELGSFVWSHIDCIAHNKRACQDEECAYEIPIILKGIENVALEYSGKGLYDSVIKLLSKGCGFVFHDILLEAHRARKKEDK